MMMMMLMMMMLIHCDACAPRCEYTLPDSVSHDHCHTTVSRQTHQAQLKEPEPDSTVTSLSTLASLAVAVHVQVSRHGPSSAHNSRSDWELQASEDQSTQHRGLVLDEIGVRALGAVEPVGFLVGPRLWRIRSWVLNLGSFAIFAYVRYVYEVHDEGRGRCEEDIAARVSVCLLVH